MVSVTAGPATAPIAVNAGVDHGSGSAASRPWWRRPGRPLVVAGIVAAWIVLGTGLRGRDTLRRAVSDTTGLHDWFSSVRDRVEGHRYTSPLFANGLTAFVDAVDGLTTFFQHLLSQPAPGRPVPVVGWLGVVALATLAGYAAGRIRLAVLTAAGLVFIGLLGLWQPGMDTLALMLSAVLLSVLVGLPLGLFIGLSTWAGRIATPVLDTMQSMPAVVYLTPLSLLFGIGGPAAVIVTTIYAMPPVIRLTAHGIAQVRESSLEAGRSLGATGWQLLRTVRLPLARRTIVVGVNQTTMAALSMLMIAVLVAAPGLGQVVLRGLETSDVGVAFTGGLAVVVLAVILDRVTTAAGRRTVIAVADRARRRRRVLAVGAALTVVAVYLSHSYYWASRFPAAAFGRGGTAGRGLGDAVSGGVSAGDDWIRLHLYPVTDTVKNVVSYGLINPLQALLAESPWYLVVAVVLGLTWALAGARSLPVAAGCLALLLASGVWSAAMETLASVLVATVLVVGLGVVLGVALARSPRVDLVVRPLLDAAQSLPAFVYLIPAAGLFGATRFTAIIAALVFALPVTTKIVADGIRAVPASTVEAATAAGSSRWQVITKVQLPLARPTVALAANQGLIYVLSVITIGALVGAGALGYLSIAGFAQSDLWGKGLAAGIAIVVLGVLLDRVTQAATRRARRTPAEPVPTVPTVPTGPTPQRARQ